MMIFLNQRGNSIFTYILVLAIIFASQSISWLLCSYVAMTQLPAGQQKQTTWSPSSRAPELQQRPYGEPLGQAQESRCQETPWCCAVNGFIPWQGWRACREPSWPLCSGCLSIQGGLLRLEQTVGPNKPKQIERNQFSANCPQGKPRVDKRVT